MKSLYKCERKFVLFDTAVSHGQLLLRADKIDGDKHNVDIIFFDTEYIELPTVIHGLSIVKFDKHEESPSANANKTVLKSPAFLSIFGIYSDYMKCFIVASHVAAFKNKLSFGETSLGVLQYQGRDKKIMSSI